MALCEADGDPTTPAAKWDDRCDSMAFELKHASSSGAVANRNGEPKEVDPPTLRFGGQAVDG